MPINKHNTTTSHSPHFSDSFYHFLSCLQTKASQSHVNYCHSSYPTIQYFGIFLYVSSLFFFLMFRYKIEIDSFWGSSVDQLINVFYHLFSLHFAYVRKVGSRMTIFIFVLVKNFNCFVPLSFPISSEFEMSCESHGKINQYV